MRSADDIKGIIKETKIKTNPKADEVVLNDLINRMNRTGGAEMYATRLNLWSTLMKSRIVKPVTVITIIMIACITFFGRFTAPAWSIEQTIEVLKTIKGIYLSGTAAYPGEPESSFEMWARPSSKDPSVSGDFKLREGDHHISIASEKQNITFVYTKGSGGDVVYITEGLNRSCNPFLTSDLFKQLKKIARNWNEEYDIDPETGRESVFVTFEGPAVNTAQYWKFEFDVETKFPVRGSVWWNEKREGQPHFDYTNIVFDPEIPDDFFEFNIPEGTQVIDCRKVSRIIDENPACGILVDSLTTAQACEKVAREYWQAVIEKDRPRLEKIRPMIDDSEWEQLVAVYEKNNPESLVDISGMNHLNDPGTFAEVTCVVSTENGKRAKAVLNVEIRQTMRGKVGVVAGVNGPELATVE